MDGLLENFARRSQLELLVREQRYEEVLALLEDAVNRNPPDRDALLIRLLVARILVLHHVLHSYQEKTPGLSKHCFSQMLESSSDAILRALRDAQAGLARRRLVFYAGYCIKLFRAGRSGRLGRRLWPRVKDLGVAAYVGILQTSKTLAVGVRSRLGMAGGGRAVLPVLAMGALGVATAVGGGLLGESFPRAPVVVARASAAKPEQGVHPRAPLPEPKSALEAKPQDEKPSLSSLIVVPPPSPGPVDLKRELADRPAAEKNQGQPEFSNVAQRPASVIKGHNQQELSAEKPTRSTDRVGDKKQIAAAKTVQPVAAQAIAHEGKTPDDIRTGRASTAYRARRSVPVRRAARFGSLHLEDLTAGTSVSVVGVINSWAEVLLDDQSTGYVRIEFLEPVQ